MSIKVDWGNAEDTLLIWRFQKDWTPRDLQNACSMAETIVAQKNQAVDVILDFGYTLTPPPNTITLIRSLLLHFPANTGKIVILGRTGFWEQIFTLALKMGDIRHSIYFARTVDDAYELVEECIS